MENKENNGSEGKETANFMQVDESRSCPEHYVKGHHEGINDLDCPFRKATSPSEGLEERINQWAIKNSALTQEGREMESYEALKSFLTQEITHARAQERAEIVGELENMIPDRNYSTDWRLGYYQARGKAISIINAKDSK